MANIVPPSVMSGAASFAMRTKESQEMSIALAKPSAEQFSRPPCRSSFGAKAMEWTRMSSLPQRSRTASKTASSCPEAETSSGATISSIGCAPANSSRGRFRNARRARGCRSFGGGLLPEQGRHSRKAALSFLRQPALRRHHAANGVHHPRAGRGILGQQLRDRLDGTVLVQTQREGLVPDDLPEPLPCETGSGRLRLPQRLQRRGRSLVEPPIRPKDMDQPPHACLDELAA